MPEVFGVEFSFLFILNSILFGIGLAMDAFSVSLANGLNEPDMPASRVGKIAGTFGIFQTAMPLIGWICIHTIVQYFTAFETMIPWIALALLTFIGGKMLIEGIQNPTSCEEKPPVGFGALVVQGIATSIDALSVGFTIAEYPLPMALVSALLIGGVTFVICLGGIYIGRKAGTHLAGKAGILGGAILIVIGLEIFITSFFG